MAFTPAGAAQTLNVTDVSTAIGLPAQPQSRLWNRGPNPCRVKYSNTGLPATGMDLIMPNLYVEVHTQNNVAFLSAICATGETAVLEISVGQGD